MKGFSLRGKNKILEENIKLRKNSEFQDILSRIINLGIRIII